MRIRTALAATALAATALLGGAGSALACEGHDATVAASGFHKEGGVGYYENLGGPAGITHAGSASHKAGGWFGFLDA
ncbi:hypothetical protein [Streptomyces odonnellii]|uniref:hypothetical protein n=1 Tax=Streptomyces odonnellii TaxID=1417980 RepID=UPI0006259BA3|nr:hypothetical protein [Streptomyces odonnellii]